MGELEIPEILWNALCSPREMSRNPALLLLRELVPRLGREVPQPWLLPLRRQWGLAKVCRVGWSHALNGYGLVIAADCCVLERVLKLIDVANYLTHRHLDVIHPLANDIQEVVQLVTNRRFRFRGCGQHVLRPCPEKGASAVRKASRHQRAGIGWNRDDAKFEQLLFLKVDAASLLVVFECQGTEAHRRPSQEALPQHLINLLGLRVQ